jgi:hypothetical protein
VTRKPGQTVVELIRSIKAEIQQHEQAALTLRAQLKQVYEDLRAEFQADPDSIHPANLNRIVLRQPRSRPIREGSSVGWARRILRQLGEPVEAGALAKSITNLSGQQTNKATLVSNLSRYVKLGDTFTRPRPGYYGLIEFDEQQDRIEAVDEGVIT